MTPGAAGQFDVVADGETVATRGGNLFLKLLDLGWPKPDDVVAALRAKQAAGAT